MSIEIPAGYRVVFSNSVTQLMLGSVLGAAAVARVAVGNDNHVLVATASQLFAYAVAILCMQRMQWETVRQEFVAGAALFTLGGFTGSGLAIKLALPWWAFAIFFSGLSGLGNTLLFSAMTKINAATFAPRDVPSVTAANDASFPFLFYGIGGFLYVREVIPLYTSAAEMADLMIWFGIAAFLTLLILIGAVVPTASTSATVGKAAHFNFFEDHWGVLFFIFAGHFNAYLPALAGIKGSNVVVGLIFNGFGRYLARMIHAVYGIEIAFGFVAVAASTALLTFMNCMVTDVNLYYIVVTTLGACIGLVGKAKHSNTASLVYGVSYFIAANWSMKFMIERQGMLEAGQGLAIGLLLSGVSVYAVRKFAEVNTRNTKARAAAEIEMPETKSKSRARSSRSKSRK